MLFDDVLSSTEIQTICGEKYPALRSAMMTALRFDLTPAFALAADEITEHNVAAPVIARELVRPPAEVTWWEVAAAFRKIGSSKPLDQGTERPKRVGVLVRSMPEGNAFEMDLFFSGVGGLIAPCFSTMCVDLANKTGDDSVYSVKDNHFISGVVLRKTPRHVVLHDRSNWPGEERYWPICMMLLNSRNIAYADPEPTGARHKKLVRQGKSPLTTFNICKIRMDRIVRSSTDIDVERRAGDVRTHFVRGHFKVRKSGLYWWKPFVRGDVKKGFAAKTYQIGGGEP
jgi:hypothetical protein